MSKIEWTQDTWNPIVGCTIVSPGCTNCYAMQMAGRIEKMNRTNEQTGYVNPYDGTTRRVNGNTVWTGKMALAENTLQKPLKRKKPTTYFVNSMGDLFHEDVPDEWIDQVMAVMALCPRHTFQVLTKRADRMQNYLTTMPHYRWPLYNHACDAGLPADATYINTLDKPLPNVWFGVSAEDQTRANERIPALLDTPAAVRFISAEPLLGPVDLTSITSPENWGANPDGWTFNSLITGDSYELATENMMGELTSEATDGPHRDAKIDWVIVGGESGHKARPMHPDWARHLRDQCQDWKAKFFFKQWGEWADCTHEFYIGPTPKEERIFTKTGEVLGVVAPRHGQGAVDEDWKERGGAWMSRIGKKAAGRMLDDNEWNEVPHGCV